MPKVSKPQYTSTNSKDQKVKDINQLILARQHRAQNERKSKSKDSLTEFFEGVKIV